MYGISVKIKGQFNTYMWKLVRPIKGKIYIYNTYKEAYDVKCMCYPLLGGDEVKVVNLDE
jgi:hypothetical protein